MSTRKHLHNSCINQTSTPKYTIPTMTQLDINVNGSGNEEDNMSKVVDIMEGAYSAWIEGRTDSNYLRSWPVESPWTEAGANKRVQICVSEICPFAVLHFYRSMIIPDLREQVVRTLIEGCENMSQLAYNVRQMFHHHALLKSMNIVQIRGHAECTESRYIRYLHKSNTACISTSNDTFDDIKNIISKGKFFLYPTTLEACSFMESIPYWKVLDLFWGYDHYNIDHGEDFDSSRHMFRNLDDFMNQNTDHDIELNKRVGLSWKCQPIQCCRHSYAKAGRYGKKWKREI